MNLPNCQRCPVPPGGSPLPLIKRVGLWWYAALGSCLLLIWLGCGGCTGAREPVQKPSHYFDKTETDFEYGLPEAAFRYHRPRGTQSYEYDDTTVDLAKPRASHPEQRPLSGQSLMTNPLPVAPLSGGDR